MSQLAELVGGNALEHGVSMLVDHGRGSGSTMYVGGQANADVAAGTTTASSTTENEASEYTIPANTLVAGSTIRVKYFVHVLDNNGSDTLQVGLRLGANTTANANAGMLSFQTNVSDADALVGDAVFQIRTAGASGTMAGWGSVATGTGANKMSMATDVSGAFAASSINTTVVNYLSVTTLWNASHADNEATTQGFVVDIVNPST